VSPARSYKGERRDGEVRWGGKMGGIDEERKMKRTVLAEATETGALVEEEVSKVR